MDMGEAGECAAIREIISRQFGSLTWQAGGAPDWDAFRADFHPGATLLPAARPVRALSVDGFADRMTGLVGDVLKSFDERVLGSRVLVFGNVAVATVACENIENGSEVNRVVEMMLLVKEDGSWQIATQGWDRATAERPVPPELLAGC